MLTQQQQSLRKNMCQCRLVTMIMRYPTISQATSTLATDNHHKKKRLSTRACQLKEGQKDMLQCIYLGHSSSSPTCKTSAYGLNNLITYDKQLIKHEETNQWPASLNSSEDISVPGHSPIINSVIFKY